MGIFGDVRMMGWALYVNVAVSGRPGNLFSGSETFLGAVCNDRFLRKNHINTFFTEGNAV